MKMQNQKDKDEAYSPEQMLALDILQARTLRTIFNSKLGDSLGARLAVKGGIAMQAVSTSRRWTSDIDFAADPLVVEDRMSHHTLVKRMGAVMKEVTRFAEQSGVLKNAKMVLAKDGASTMRWKVSGETENGSTVSMKIEISGRDNVATDLVTKAAFTPHGQPEGGGTFSIRSYAPMLLAASKVGGMLDGEDGSMNHRLKARDVYDLYVLITEVTIEPPKELLAALGRPRLDRALDEVLIKIESMDYSYVVSGLLPYLPEKEAAALTAEKWEEIRIEVALAVEQWITDARAIAPEEYIPRSQVGEWMNERKSTSGGAARPR